MQLTKPMIFLIVGTAMAIGVIRLTFLSVSKAQSFAGCPADLSKTGIDPTQTIAVWNNLPITPLTSLAETLSESQKKVLGTSTDKKWIEVDLSDQKLIAHQGNSIFLESLISSGLWGKTPPGEYAIWYKVRATKMEGGNRATNTYYYLPNVPYAMFFKGDFGIHGTYWHQNFGKPMSHGCVNAPTPIAEKLFYWTDPQVPEGQWAVRSTDSNPGTRVVVHE
ncbi:MAG: L,D-transpeptidase [Patescibacteria group bacterium]